MTQDGTSSSEVRPFLDALSGQIKATWADAKAHQFQAFEGYLHVGHLLRQAREQLPSDTEFGRWFVAQDFGFSTTWGARLRRLAEQEPDVRALVETAVSSGEAVPGVNRMLQLLAGPSRLEELESVIERDLSGIEEQRVELTAAVDAVIQIPMTSEGAADRLVELDGDIRLLRAKAAYLRALLEDEE